MDIDDAAVVEALRIAGDMIDAGIPVFAAPPCPSGPFGEGLEPCGRPGHAAGGVEYDLPGKWQFTVPSRVWLERWRPGWALAAVGGAVADFLDEDPRSGGDASVGQLHADGVWPATFGEADTPSGGRHYVIPPLHERKAVGFLPGLDYQGGLPTDGKGGGGQGRGFIWIAPTVKRSKIDGVPHAYRWTTTPDLPGLAAQRDAGGASSEGVRKRLHAARATRDGALRTEHTRLGTRALRMFTETQAREFCDITLQRVMTAEIGRIEEEANAAACALSHFVPEFFTSEQAYDVLLAALGETAYDPTHPASSWTAEKFHAVLAGQGGRAPDDWYAGRVAETQEEASARVTPDEVDALIAEMIEPDELIKRKPPRHVIRGVLTFDSESWLIGAPGSKKSFVALDMAARVSLGLPWQERPTIQARVVVIAAEGAGGIGKRLDAWKRRYAPPEGFAPGWFKVLPRPVQAKDLGAWAVLVAACERLEAGFIVIDTQARVTVGLEENSATDIGVYLAAARALRAATGACVLTVHHTGRRGGDARGSSAIDGAQDTELKVESEGLDAVLYTEKQKDIEPAEPIKLRFDSVDLGHDEEGEPVNSLVLLPHDKWRAAAVDGQGLDDAEREAARDVTPFTVREAVEGWTYRVTHPNAKLQRWVIQTLADVGYDTGLTETRVRALITEKVGTLRTARSTQKTVDTSTWTDAWQAVVSGSHPAQMAGVVVKIHGVQRWTVDPTVVEKMRHETN